MKRTAVHMRGTYGARQYGPRDGGFGGVARPPPGDRTRGACGASTTPSPADEWSETLDRLRVVLGSFCANADYCAAPAPLD